MRVGGTGMGKEEGGGRVVRRRCREGETLWEGRRSQPEKIRRKGLKEGRGGAGAGRGGYNRVTEMRKRCR